MCLDICHYINTNEQERWIWIWIVYVQKDLRCLSKNWILPFCIRPTYFHFYHSWRYSSRSLIWSINYTGIGIAGPQINIQMNYTNKRCSCYSQALTWFVQKRPVTTKFCNFVSCSVVEKWNVKFSLLLFCVTLGYNLWQWF